MAEALALGEISVDTWCVRNRGFPSNTYLCRLADGDGCLVIDPGLDFDGLESAFRSLGLTPRAIFCTHGHFDHIGSAAELQERYAIQLYLHRDDAKVARSARFNMMVYGVEGSIVTPSLDVLVDDGDAFLDGSDQVLFIHTPGHTPGSCCVLHRDTVFTGDTLYRDGVGDTTSPATAMQLRASLARIAEAVPDASMICPGHGGAATFAAVKRENLAFREVLGDDA